MTNTTNFPETAAKLAEVTAFESVVEMSLQLAGAQLTKLQDGLKAAKDITTFLEFNAHALVKAQARVAALTQASTSGELGAVALASYIKFLIKPSGRHTDAYARANAEARVDAGWELLSEFKTYLDVTQIV